MVRCLRASYSAPAEDEGSRRSRTAAGEPPRRAAAMLQPASVAGRRSSSARPRDGGQWHDAVPGREGHMTQTAVVNVCRRRTAKPTLTVRRQPGPLSSANVRKCRACASAAPSTSHPPLAAGVGVVTRRRDRLRRRVRQAPGRTSPFFSRGRIRGRRSSRWIQRVHSTGCRHPQAAPSLTFAGQHAPASPCGRRSMNGALPESTGDSPARSIVGRTHRIAAVTAPHISSARRPPPWGGRSSTTCRSWLPGSPPRRYAWPGRYLRTSLSLCASGRSADGPGPAPWSRLSGHVAHPVWRVSSDLVGRTSKGTLPSSIITDRRSS